MTLEDALNADRAGYEMPGLRRKIGYKYTSAHPVDGLSAPGNAMTNFQWANTFKNSATGISTASPETQRNALNEILGSDSPVPPNASHLLGNVWANARPIQNASLPGQGGFSFGSSALPVTSFGSPIATQPPRPLFTPLPAALPPGAFGNVLDSGVSSALNPQGFLTTTTQGVGGNFISPMSYAERRQTELQYAPRDSMGFPMPVTGRFRWGG